MRTLPTAFSFSSRGWFLCRNTVWFCFRYHHKHFKLYDTLPYKLVYFCTRAKHCLSKHHSLRDSVANLFSKTFKQVFSASGYSYCHIESPNMNSRGTLNTFSSSPLDRLNNKRGDLSLLQECQQPELARYLIFFNRQPLLEKVNTSDGKILQQAHIAWFKAQDPLVQQLIQQGRSPLLLGKWIPPDHIEEQSTPEFIGKVHNKYCFVLDASDISTNEQLASLGVEPMNIRSLLSGIHFNQQEAAVLAHAQSLLEFHSRHQYCGRCGSLTTVGSYGNKRICESGCGMEWFPRSDPVIIVAVIKDGHLLMGRQSRWPVGRYSVIAGFMEHGESIEDAIAREVKEETQIVVGRCRYHSSQPWPFPYSLMLGFMAEGLSSNIQVDKEELQDAKWFSREQVGHMLSNQEADGFRGPPPQSIAYELCYAFACGEDICDFTDNFRFFYKKQ